MSTTLIRIPAERAEQLKTLAAARGLAVPQLIDALVLDAIKAGEIPDTTPGLSIAETREGQVTITVDEVTTSPMSKAEALGIAEELTAKNKRCLSIIGPDVIETGPVGMAVELKIIAAGKSARRVFTRTIAADVARQIRAIAEKEKLTA